MRTWLKLLIGSVLGLIVGRLLPDAGGDTLVVLESLFGIVLGIGRYVVIPLVFLNTASALRELRSDGKAFGFGLWSLLMIVAVTAVTVMVGALSVVILTPDRIPLIMAETALPTQPGVLERISEVFPTNILQTISGSGSFLLPAFVAAVIVGVHLLPEDARVRFFEEFIEGAGLVVERINRFVINVMMVGAVVLSATWMMRVRSVVDIAFYRQLITVVVFSATLLLLVIFPVLLRLIAGRMNPYHWLYAVAGPLFLALFSGDAYLTLSGVLRVSESNLGVKREHGSVFYPLAAVFSRPGTAMIVTISFITVLRSYSSLEIAASQYLVVAALAFAASFVLGGVPRAGALFALAYLSQWYTAGREEGFLLLVPIMPILVSVGVLLDGAAWTFMSYLLTHRLGIRRDTYVSDYE